MPVYFPGLFSIGLWVIFLCIYKSSLHILCISSPNLGSLFKFAFCLTEVLNFSVVKFISSSFKVCVFYVLLRFFCDPEVIKTFFCRLIFFLFTFRTLSTWKLFFWELWDRELILFYIYLWIAGSASLVHWRFNLSLLILFHATLVIHQDLYMHRFWGGVTIWFSVSFSVLVPYYFNFSSFMFFFF